MCKRILFDDTTDIQYLLQEWQTIEAFKEKIFDSPFYFNIRVEHSYIENSEYGRSTLNLGDLLGLQDYFASFLDTNELLNDKIFIYQLKHLQGQMGLLVGYGKIFGNYVYVIPNIDELYKDILPRLGIPKRNHSPKLLSLYTTPSIACLYNFIQAIKTNKTLENYMVDYYENEVLTSGDDSLKLIPTNDDNFYDIAKPSTINWKKLKRERINNGLYI